MKKLYFAIFYFSNTVLGYSQPDDRMIIMTTMPAASASANYDSSKIAGRSGIKPYIIPVISIAYGVTALQSRKLQAMDKEIQEEIWQDNPHKPFSIDNYLQYTPAFMVYGLNIAGVKGKHNLVDRSMIYLMSNVMMGAIVQSVKAITKIPRPDGGGTNAFPSGHTATAFVSAEFLRQEYKDVSPWYGIAGYAMATTTAYLRMYNNKHWFRDLLPGAGIGILCTDLSYKLYPLVKNKIAPRKPTNTMVMPYYQPGEAGLAFVHRF